MATATLTKKRRKVEQRLPELHRFSVEQYVKMVEVGVIGPDERVELHEGWIVEKMSRNPPHDSSLNDVASLLYALLPKQWMLRNQSALVLARSVPAPDLAIVRGPKERYRQLHPRPADVGLLIEIADSSRLSDRRMKGRWYAEAKVPQFWLVNLVQGQVEVYTRPKAGKLPAYRNCKIFHKGDQVPLILDDKELGKLDVADLCPVKA